jgi:S1-C subfamily serine protease
VDQEPGQPGAPPPQYSPDLRWWWDGRTWVPVSPPDARARGFVRPALAGMAIVLVLLVGAGGVGAVAGPLIFRAAAGAISAARGASQSPAAPATPAGQQDLEVAAPPGAQAVPAAASGAPAPAGPVDAAVMGSRLASATVLIDAQLRHHSYDSAGTGIVLTSSGLVLTDEHVVTDAESVTAQIGGTGDTYQAALIGVDLAEDVALLQLEKASHLATATLGRSASVGIGEQVVVIGYPNDTAPASVGGRVIGLGDSVDVTDNSYDQGTTNESKVTYSGMLHSTAHSLSGQSGGPVVDGAGRVVGMDQVGGDSDDFDIPIDRALAAAREIAAGHANADIVIGAPADLGLVARNWTSSSGAAGAKVTTVYSGTPAQSIGLRRGDVVTAIDGAAIASAVELRQVLLHHRPGDRVSVGWTDSGGHRHTVRVTLMAGSAA